MPPVSRAIQGINSSWLSSRTRAALRRIAARSSYGVAAQPGCAARASLAARRTSAAVALPTLVILAPVAGSCTSSEPPAALRHSVPKTRPSQVFSIKNFGAGTFIVFSSLRFVLFGERFHGRRRTVMSRRIYRFPHSRTIAGWRRRLLRNPQSQALPRKSRPRLLRLAFVLGCDVGCGDQPPSHREQTDVKGMGDHAPHARRSKQHEQNGEP